MRALLLCLATPFLTADHLAAQTEPALALDRVTVRTLKNADPHVYELELEAGLFVYGEVDQRTVDVAVQIHGPSGEFMRSFDTPSRGVEFFEFVTEKPGPYRISIAPYEQERGEYAVTLRRLEPVAMVTEERIDQTMARYDGEDRPGAVVAHVRDGKVVFEKSYGMAHLQWGIPNASDIKYDLGSTSKQFTGFAILLLEQRGELALDDDVRKYLPEVPDFGATVTLRNLLTHTSGYRELMNLLYMTGREPEDQFEQHEVLAMLQRQPALQEPPGTVFRYNNTGYYLLALVIERVTGESFSDFLRANVFAPLGMHDTDVRSERGKVIPRTAEGYQTSAVRGYRRGVQNAPLAGPSNVHSTVHDMAKWMDQLKTGDLGGKELIEALTTPHVLADGTATIYGLGIRIGEDRGLRRFSHSGGSMSFRSWMAYYPDLDEGLVLFGNSSEFHRSAIDEVADALFGKAMQPAGEPAALRPGGGSSVFPPDPRPSGSLWQPSEAELSACTGRFLSDELETLWTLVHRDGLLYARHYRLGDIPLTPAQEDCFRADYPFSQLVLSRSAAGSVTGFAASTSKNRGVLFRKLE